MVTSTRPIIAVTGSSGLIGSALIRRLAPRYHLIGFDREGPPHPPEEAECVSLDLSSDPDVKAALHAVRKNHGSHLAAVVHLAAYYSFSEKESPLYDAVTVRGTERLLRELQTFEVEQFIFSSTMLVHAPCEVGQRIKETSPIQAKWAYPESKVKTERIIEETHGKIPAVNLRISGVYSDACQSIPISHQIQRLYERQLTSHLFPGRMDHGQSFMHLDDLIDLLEVTIERRKQLPAYVSLLAGEEDTVSFSELQATISQLLHGHPSWTLRIPKWVAKFGAWLQLKLGIGDGFIHPWMIDLADDHYALDISKAKSLLGWQPKRSLRKTLPIMIDALKANPAQWYKENKLNGVPK